MTSITPRNQPAGTLMSLLAPLVFALIVPMSLGGDFEITRSTVDGGGEMFTTGGAYELSGTIGQHDAGLLSGGAYALTGGFWFEQVCGDCKKSLIDNRSSPSSRSR